MAVSPSFQNCAIVSDIYIKGGKNYVDVKNPRTGNVRSVRWYTDAEYAKQYGSKTIDPQTDKYGGLKAARGFSAGPIFVVRNNKPSDEEWLGKSIARYAVGTGWYFTSTDTLPADTPAHFKFLSLSWNEARDGCDTQLKSPTKIAAILSEKARKGAYLPIPLGADAAS